MRPDGLPPRRRTHATAVAAASVSCALAVACGSSDPVDLALRFEPSDIVRVGPEASDFIAGAQLIREDGNPWVEIRFGEGDAALEPIPWPYIYRARLPALSLRRSFAPGQRLPRLRAGGVEWLYSDASAIPLDGSIAPETLLALRGFTTMGDNLIMIVPGDEAPPTDLVLHLPLSYGRRVDGRWRSALGQLTGDAVAVWPGERWGTLLEAGRGRTLAGFFAADAVPIDDEAHRAPLVWTVHHDGVEIGRGKLVPEVGQVTWLPFAFEVPNRAGVLSFEVAGGAARSAFIAPRVAPARTGKRNSERDVALFLADTFRADLLGFPTPLGSLTPTLDSFAQTAARFDRTWSPASWTLPAHASLFTGLQPSKHGAYGRSSRLAPDAITLAERLQLLGYRTLALTDAGFVARAFGIDQGFEVFLEEDKWGELDLGFERLDGFLNADDDRPLFLFFHTYRTHGPYRVDPQTAERFGPLIGLGREWGELIEHLATVGWSWDDPQSFPMERSGELAELRALYRGGAIDLDRKFGEWLALLDRRGRGAGVVLFTSDHGEAFGEHDGFVGHSLGLWDEQTRVPLLIRAPGVKPGPRSTGASLVDVPRTLAALLDIATPAGWEGRALLGRGQERSDPHDTVELFTSPTDIALVQGHRKLHAKGNDLGAVEVFDLEQDPGEKLDLAVEHSTWAARHVENLLFHAPGWRVPRFQLEEANMNPKLLAQLRALGYTDGD